MSAFAQVDFNATRYASERPTYPKKFYQLLDTYHQGHHDTLVDVGCGPGIATFQLVGQLSPFKAVYGTDISPPMIEEAKKLQHLMPYGDNVQFEVSSYDDYTFIDTSVNKIDLITAGECAHWFNFNNFQDAVCKSLEPNGTLAIWGYCDPIIVEYPELDREIEQWHYGSDTLGPYWQEPGRSILRSCLRDYDIDKTKFKDIKKSYTQAEDYREKKAPQKELFLVKQLTLYQFRDYLKTSSAYHNWRQDPKNQNKSDTCEEFISSLIERYPTLADKDTTITIAWNTFYILARKI